MTYIFYIIFIVATLVFCLDRGIFGESLRDIYKSALKIENIGYLVLLILLIILYLNSFIMLI